MVSQEVAFAQNSSQKAFYDFIKFAHRTKQGVSLVPLMVLAPYFTTNKPIPISLDNRIVIV